jgi:hypothetical protein
MWFKIPHFLEELKPNFYLLPIPIIMTGVMAVHLLNIMPVDSGQSLHTLLAGYLFGGFGIALALFYLVSSWRPERTQVITFSFLIFEYQFVYFLRMVLHGHGNGDQVSPCETPGELVSASLLTSDNAISRQLVQFW